MGWSQQHCRRNWKRPTKCFFPKADNKFRRKFSRTEFGAVGCAAFSTSAWKGIRHSGWKFSLLVGTGWRYFIFYVPCLHRADSVGEAGQIFHFWVHTYIWKDIPKLGTLPNVSMLVMLSYPNIEVKGPLHNSKWNVQEMKQKWLLCLVNLWSAFLTWRACGEAVISQNLLELAVWRE